jgi:hypothetical protein
MRLDPKKSVLGGIAIAAVAGATWLAAEFPVLRALPEIRIPAWRPASQGPEVESWNVLPFFYAIGAFPRFYQGTPVFHSLPYAKGPPQQFVPEVVLRLKMPLIRLTLRGPKTPAKVPAADLKECFQGFLHCRSERKAILHPILEEFARLNLKVRSISWFETDGARESARGLWVQAEGPRTHVVLVTPEGTQQALVFEGPETDATLQQVIRQVVGSLQVSDDLSFAKSLAYSELEKIQLSRLNQLEDTQVVLTEFAHVQAVLLSKISVEPGGYQAYYHLAGSTLLMAQHAAEVRTRKTQIIAGPLLDMLEEVLAVAQPVVRAAYLYAKDLAPDSPQTKKMEELWFAVQAL